jgi:hypothetical protein
MQHPALSHPYREIAEPPTDEEAVALARLAARARRVRRAVGLPILAAGLAAPGTCQFLLRDLLFAAMDVHAAPPYITAFVTAFPLFVLAQGLAAYAGRKAIAARSQAWIAEIAATPGVSPSLLEAFARLL